MRRVFHITLLLSVLGISPAFPQSPSTGAQLSGTILDPNGAVVPGARVTLRSETTGFEQSTTADAAGQYAFLFPANTRWRWTPRDSVSSRIPESSLRLANSPSCHSRCSL